MKAIETNYKGYRFRSRLEARWAVFFNALGIKWEYEPEGYVLDDGLCYLPDFKLHGFVGRANGDIYVEVKGNLSDNDFNKINSFYNSITKEKVKNKILILSNIPNGNSMNEIDQEVEDAAYNGIKTESNNVIYPFNFATIDGDYFAAHIGINKDGKPELFGDDSSYLFNRDDNATFEAFLKARQARFEFGERPDGGNDNERL